jgi:hypothetical protein
MSNTDTEDDPMRALTKALFKDEPDEPAAPPDPRPGNFVAREGDNPSSKDAGDERELVRQLFAPDPDA